VTIAIPKDATYLYILNNNGARESLLPQQVVFSMQEEAPPATYSLNLDITTYTGCLAGGTSWKTQCDNLCYQFDLSELKAQGYTKMTVTANTSGRSLIAMFTEQMPTSGISNAISPNWATGWSKQQQIDAGQTQAFGIPDDATYLFVLYTGTNVSCPQSIVFSK
ncbi:MAG: hypothetical protein IKZ15_04690, partial [Clostridia bacterium]|nr:hypothetical protein [Clostridia bacterium]